MNIGLYEGHCFYIKDLNGLTQHWECDGCEQRFNRHDNYNRHVTENLCSGGKTKLICKGGKFKHIMNSTEKVFYGGNTQFSYVGCRWIEKQSADTGKHIHHALCGHGVSALWRLMEKRFLLMDTNLKVRLCINSMVAYFMDVLVQVINEMRIGIKQPLIWMKRLKTWVIKSFLFGACDI